jgi:hypothetical protein
MSLFSLDSEINFARTPIRAQFDYSASDINATILGLLPTLVQVARESARYATESYRVKVGVSALAYDNSEDSPRIGIYSDGNFKMKIHEEYDERHEVKDVPKICGEADIIAKADQDDMRRIGIFVIASSTRRELIKSVNKVNSATLPPCWFEEEDKDNCDSIMGQNHLVDNRTMLFGIGSGTDVFQIQSYGEYHKRYAAVKKSGDLESYVDAPLYRFMPIVFNGMAVSEYERIVNQKNIAGRDDVGNHQHINMRQHAAYKAIKYAGLYIRG